MALHKPSTVRSAALAQERLELGEGVLDGVEVYPCGEGRLPFVEVKRHC